MTLLFKRAEVTSSCLKMGLMGFAGSGKTYTATVTAIGLIEHMRSLKIAGADKPLYFLDTETGSDWVKPKIEKAGIELATAKTRAFTDLLAAVKEAEAAGSPLLLIDSITHFWVELCDSYMRAKKRTRLQFEDWAYLKGEWRKFTDLFINSKLHIVLCGRAGYEYDYFTDEAGKKQLEKTDIKMKAEGEMGYEPSLLVLMERHTDLEAMKAYRTATVLKDRATMIDGKQFRNPKFADFLPHVNALNLGGRQMGVDTSRTSEATHPADIRDNNRVQRKIVIDEIESLIVMHFPGQAAADKKKKIELLRTHFAASWTEIEELMPLFDLRAGYESLHQALEGKPSRYGKRLAEAAAPEKPEINDAIPDFDGVPPFLRRVPEKQPAPADAIDEKAWLAKLARMFSAVEEIDGIKRAHAEQIKPQRDRVSIETYAAAEAIARGAFDRIAKMMLAA